MAEVSECRKSWIYSVFIFDGNGICGRYLSKEKFSIFVSKIQFLITNLKGMEKPWHTQRCLNLLSVTLNFPSSFWSNISFHLEKFLQWLYLSKTFRQILLQIIGQDVANGHWSVSCQLTSIISNKLRFVEPKIYSVKNPM